MVVVVEDLYDIPSLNESTNVCFTKAIGAYGVSQAARYNIDILTYRQSQ